MRAGTEKELLACISSGDAVRAAEIIGMEIAKQLHAEELIEFGDLVPKDFEEFMGDAGADWRDWEGHLGALSELIFRKDHREVFGLKLRFIGLNSAKIISDSTFKASFEIVDDADPNKPITLGILRITGFDSSYDDESTFYEDETVFVREYDTLVKKFYTDSERAKAKDQFI